MASSSGPISAATGKPSAWRRSTVARSQVGLRRVSPYLQLGPDFDLSRQMILVCVNGGELLIAGQKLQVIDVRGVRYGWERRRSAGAPSEIGQGVEELGRPDLLLSRLRRHVELGEQTTQGDPLDGRQTNLLRAELRPLDPGLVEAARAHGLSVSGDAQVSR